ncbi:NADH-quinone oxidoreductase subunit J [Phaeovibrio sulfidiphilus]|uniref:NADH-quinone oxidoreductase subunit J n=1 Tax=Phaeovibrio sulfidiphilus TaxID=1220600 RepID=A0A8J6YVC5_9PROT|nr:NADH-quinone oxidoreductase subunit J [Phaeovibrio sulfidiphilus]MBE1237079.1 NADH-quinone oxidoreductase subunit J [Phaeovibrio sulfidiphilus]
MTLAVDAVFYLFSIVCVVSALMVVVSRNPVHSVLWMITVFINGAGLFVLLNAEFLAMVLVIVYAGAVAILFTFVVMMLDLDFTGPALRSKQTLLVGLAVGAVLLGDLFVMLSEWSVSPKAEALRASPTPDLSTVSNTVALSRILYTDYIFLFQTAGLILLVAMVGAVLLTFRRQRHQRQDVSVQLARSKSETLKMNRVENGKGIS